MAELSQHGHGGRQLHVYLQHFQWPKAYASGRDVCKGNIQERQREKNVPPAGSASELLSVGPVVRKWLLDVIKPARICPTQVASLLLCIEVMGLLLGVNAGCISPAMLADAMAKHYAAHVVAATRSSCRSTTLCCISTSESTRLSNGGPSPCALPGNGVTNGVCS